MFHPIESDNVCLLYSYQVWHWFLRKLPGSPGTERADTQRVLFFLGGGWGWEAFRWQFSRVLGGWTPRTWFSDKMSMVIVGSLFGSGLRVPFQNKCGEVTKHLLSGMILQSKQGMWLVRFFLWKRVRCTFTGVSPWSPWLKKSAGNYPKAPRFVVNLGTSEMFLDHDVLFWLRSSPTFCAHQILTPEPRKCSTLSADFLQKKKYKIQNSNCK